MTGRKIVFRVSFAVVVVAIIAGLGLKVGERLESSADDNDIWVDSPLSGNNCARANGSTEQVPEPEGPITVSGLPAKIETDYGYGRGTRVIDGNVFAASAAEDELPETMAVTLLPLQRGTDRAIDTVAASAERIGTTANYRLRVCIDAPDVLGGTYEGKLVFTSRQVVVESTPVVTARFQNEWVPYMFTVALPFGAIVGILYSGAVLIRRAKPDIGLRAGIARSWTEVWSWNGMFALIAGIGAAFGVWQASCNANPTWGNEWTQVPVTVIAIIGAAAGTATVPLGLSRQAVE